ILQQFRSTGERIIALDDFKSSLMLDGKYKDFKTLNRDLIKPCAALYSARVFMQPFFYPDHGFGMILNKNKSLKPIFCAKFASGRGCSFH
ncbi:replication initiation protein, partial [Escherichia coli]|uniref:replication initiation protein n=1 Tax=Escherichia coli TaxID=562 RepID=UPI00208DC2D6